MTYDPRIHHRRSIRIKKYDYNQPNFYFVTICTDDRRKLSGEIIEGRMHLNDAAEIAQAQWETLPNRFPTVHLDASVIMPNHLHGIICIDTYSLPPRKEPIACTVTTMLGEAVRAFKAATTRSIRVSGIPEFAWQRGYFEHILRNQYDLDRVRRYITDNPMKWHLDQFYR